MELLAYILLPFFNNSSKLANGESNEDLCGFIGSQSCDQITKASSTGRACFCNQNSSFSHVGGEVFCFLLNSPHFDIVGVKPIQELDVTPIPFDPLCDRHTSQILAALMGKSLLNMYVVYCEVRCLSYQYSIWMQARMRIGSQNNKIISKAFQRTFQTSPLMSHLLPTMSTTVLFSN